MIDFEMMEQTQLAAAVIRNDRVRKLRAQQEPPEIRQVEPEGRYTISAEKARENQRTLRELQKVLEKAAVIGVVKKLRESNAYLEFDPKLSKPNESTFLTSIYPKLSEAEERTLDEAIAWMEGFHEYSKNVGNLLSNLPDKLTGADLEKVEQQQAEYEYYHRQSKKVAQTIAELSRKKYSQKPIGRRELT